jgi:hypothetical protein
MSKGLIDWFGKLYCAKGKIIDVRTSVMDDLKIITITNSLKEPQTFVVDPATGMPLAVGKEAFVITNQEEGFPLYEALKDAKERGAMWATPRDLELLYTQALKGLGWTPPK